MLKIKETVRDGENVELELEGDIVKDSLQPLNREACDFIENPYIKKFGLNLSKVSFIDSSGLGTIVRFQKECQQNGKEYYLKQVHPDIMKIFEITRVDQFLTILD